MWGQGRNTLKPLHDHHVHPGSHSNSAVAAAHTHTMLKMGYCMVSCCIAASHRHTSKAFSFVAVTALGLYRRPLRLGQCRSGSPRELLCGTQRASSSCLRRPYVADVGPRVQAPAAGPEGRTPVPCQRATAANRAVERLCVCARVEGAHVCVLKSVKMAGRWRERDLFNCSAEAWPTYSEAGAVYNHRECN